MTTFTRITVIGSSRRATMVVPAEEPLATLIPDIANLLQEQYTATSGALTLVGPLGDEIDPGSSCEEQQIVDGQVLRLVRVEDAPPPPEVSDVTDVVAETLDRSGSRWSAAHRSVAGALAIGALALAGTLPLVTGADPASGAWWGIAVYAAAAVLALALGRFTGWAGIAATAAALGAAPAAAVWTVGFLPNAPVSFASALFGLGWLAIGLGFGVGQRDRAPMVGSATAVALAGIALTLAAVGVPETGIAAIIAVLVTAAIGLLPVIALNFSKVATLDDLAIAGEPLERGTVLERVAMAYRTFGWSVYALAIAAAVATAALLRDASVWPGILGGALALVLLLRTRAVPLAVQAWPLWAAGVLGPTVGLALRGGLPGWAAGAAAAGAVVLVAILVLARPRPHTRVRLRRLGDALEGLAVLVMVPAVLGVFGVYELVLGVF